MTLSRHTFLLKFGIAAAAFMIAGLAAISFKILPYYPELVDAALRRSGYVFINARKLSPFHYAAYITMAASIVYALLTLILLFYYFEKTQSVEAHFFMFFVFSFVFESLRAILPLRMAFDLPSIYLSFAAHFLVFCRYFGIFSLFCASLYSAGFKTKEENLIFPLIIIALFIAFRIPVNKYTWDTSLCLVSAYPLAFWALEISTALLTVLSFLCGAFMRGQKEYYIIGAGAFFALAGRMLLFSGDTLILPVIGLCSLSAGTYIICSNLRRLYLWV
ncbi:MAG: hypothetical protein LBC77_06720 [Spirochaetaceae bacterium]|jgi:hypothetical protein|nr:hypothetical protein [Spirochaetaceae bacterium]